MDSKKIPLPQSLNFPKSIEAYQLPKKYYFWLWVISFLPLFLHWVHVDLGLRNNDSSQFYLLNYFFPQDLAFFLYTILEWSVFCSVSFIFLLTFFYYRITHNVVTFFISFAFLCIALIDIFSTLIHLKGFQEGKYIVETWMIRRFFGLFILFCGICFFQFSKKPERRKSAFVVLAMFLTFLAVVILYTLNHQSGRFFSFTPILLQKIIPAINIFSLLFMLIGWKFIFPYFFQKAPSFFSYLLALSIIPHVFCQIYFSFASTATFDHYFYSALFLQIFANVMLFFGLILDTKYIYQLARSTQGKLQLEISKREEIEDNFHESITRWIVLVNSSVDGIILINTEGIVEFFNPSAEMIFGYKSEEIKGKNIKMLMPSPYYEEHDQYLENYLRTGIKKVIGTHIQVRGRQKDGNIIIIELTVSEIIQEKKRVFAGIIRDITQRKILEQDLIEAKEEAESLNIAKSQFLANMSHELRTPLNSVIGFANILIKNKLQNLTAQDLSYLEKIQRNGKQLLEIINNILDLSKIEEGKIELVIETFDLRILIEETLQNLEPQFLEKEQKVKLMAKFPKEMKPLRTDRSKLKQVLINLIANALKFTDEGYIKIIVSIDEDSHPTQIDVMDTGLGIPQDKIDGIFEAFHQADNTIARKYGGTGLGLAICRALLNLLDFNLQVTSTEGEGSRFTILLRKTIRITVSNNSPRLEMSLEDRATQAIQVNSPVKVPTSSSILFPVTEKKETSSKKVSLSDSSNFNKTMVYQIGELLNLEPAESQKENTEIDLSGKYVLVIDDDRDSVEFLIHYLQKLGAEIFYSASGEEGVIASRLHLPHLIFLDLLMPQKNGWEVLSDLMADPELKEVPVIIYSEIAHENKTSLPQAVGFLEKPGDKKEIQREIRKCFQQKERIRLLIIEKDKDFRQILLSLLNRRRYFENRSVSNWEEAEHLIPQFNPDYLISERKILQFKKGAPNEKFIQIEKDLNILLQNLSDVSDIFPEENTRKHFL